MREQLDYRGRAYGVQETHHTPFDQTPPGDRKVRVSQMLQYFLVELLRVYENTGVTPHIHVVHIRVLRGYEEALHFEALFGVIF